MDISQMTEEDRATSVSLTRCFFEASGACILLHMECFMSQQGGQGKSLAT